jgi:hypothetical protein
MLEITNSINLQRVVRHANKPDRQHPPNPLVLSERIPQDAVLHAAVYGTRNLNTFDGLLEFQAALHDDLMLLQTFFRREQQPGRLETIIGFVKCGALNVKHSDCWHERIVLQVGQRDFKINSASAVDVFGCASSHA